MRLTVLCAIVLLGSFACLASDQFDVKPGLWNVTSTMEMSGMPPIPNLDQMTPEQRARVEAAMKNMAGAPHTNTAKSCITKEGIEKAIAKANSNQNNSCSPKLVSMTPSKVLLHIDCTRESSDMKSNGDMTIERVDSEHFKGSGAMQMAGARGRTMNMKWSMTGVFVSSDCGSLKPADQ
jgi:Protein of unknown function (DUF3617)